MIVMASQIHTKILVHSARLNISWLEKRFGNRRQWGQTTMKNCNARYCTKERMISAHFASKNMRDIGL